jgi:Fe-S oxidoreductase
VAQVKADGDAQFDLDGFMRKGLDGKQNNVMKKFDYQDFYGFMENIVQMMLSKEEINWIERRPTTEEKVPVFMNMSCGTQLAPHTGLETVNIFKALGVEFVAGTGRQYCCGKILRVHDKPGAGKRMSQASINRFREWGAMTAVHHCPSCQMIFDDHVKRTPDAAPAGFTNKHFSTFLEERLLQLGDKVPWKRKVDARVLLESYGWDTISPVHAEVVNTAERILSLVPGVHYIGRLEMPSQGAACLTHAGGLTTESKLSPEEFAAMQDELRQQLQARGANVISPVDKFCQREWSKFAADDIPVRHYLSIVADALGCDEPDRFQLLWQLHDTKAILEATRPYWTSWGVDEKTATWLVARQFDSSHTGFEPICACGGDPDRCTTGKFKSDAHTHDHDHASHA